MFDDGTGASHITECQCTVVYDISGHPEAAQYKERTKAADGWHDPDIAVVFRIFFNRPCATGKQPEAPEQIHVKCAITS